MQGARGGHASLDTNPTYRGGLGARAWGTFRLKAGSVLIFVIGQMGNNVPVAGSSSSQGGGGGGGTFVWLESDPSVPLLVAGGGGGAAYTTNSGSNAALRFSRPT